MTSHSIRLSGLTPGTTYYYRVRSVDSESNIATASSMTDPPLSFATPGPTCGFDDIVADFSAGTPESASPSRTKTTAK